MSARLRLRAAALVMVALTACAHAPPPEPVTLVLRRADAEGGYTFGGGGARATLVYFFSTWCVPCQAMDLSVAEAFEAGRREGIEVVAVAVDREGARTVGPWVRATRPPYPVVLGGADVAEGRSALGRIPELPAVLVLYRDARPAEALLGIVPSDRLLARARAVAER